MRVPTPLTLALALLAIGTGAARADDWNRSYGVAAKPNVEILTDDGHVRVLIGDGHTVQIRVHTVGWRIEPGGIRIHEQQDGNHIRFEAREPHYQLSLFLNPRRVQIEVTVPRELALEVETGDGSVELPALSGVIRVHSGDGSIEAEGLKGDLRLESGDGHIHAHDLAGALFGHTGDGSVNVSGRFDRLALSSGDGRIEAEAARGSRVTDGWDLHTGDGSITLRVPNDFAADIDADTGDGSIDTDIPVTLEGRVTGRVSKHVLRGHINGGGGLLQMRSGDGSIHISTL